MLRLVIATAVQFYDVVVFFHILAVVVAFGPTFAYGMFFAIAAKHDLRAMPTIGRAVIAWDSTVGTAAQVVILLAGVYATADVWEFSDFFVSWGIVAVLVVLGVTHGFMLPTSRRVVAIADRDIAAAGSGEVTFSDEFNRLTGRLNLVGALLGLLVALTIYVMTAKPFI